MVVFGDERPEAVSRISSFRPDVIRPQGAKNGAIFAIMVDLNADVRNRGTNTIAEVICHGDNLAQGCLVKCRGTNNDGVDNMSRYESLKAGRCGNPGLALITNLSNVQENKYSAFCYRFSYGLQFGVIVRLSGQFGVWQGLQMHYNGPAIKGRLCYPTRAPAGSWFFSQKMVTVQGGYGTCFCSHGLILL